MTKTTQALTKALMATALALSLGTPTTAAADPDPGLDPGLELHTSKSKPQADRWGLFLLPTPTAQISAAVGEWAPTFFALGTAALTRNVLDDEGGRSQMISTIHNLGIRNEHAYAAGYAHTSQSTGNWDKSTYRPLTPVNRDATAAASTWPPTPLRRPGSPEPSSHCADA